MKPVINEDIPDVEIHTLQSKSRKDSLLQMHHPILLRTILQSFGQRQR